VIAKRCCKADRLSYRAAVQNKQDYPEDSGSDRAVAQKMNARAELEMVRH
jgi:hypothetical protein